MAEDINIYAFIGTKRSYADTAEYLSGQQIADAIAKVTADEINLRISSGGGSVTDGNLMINAMKASGKKITAVIDGYAASMGYFVCLGASKIVAAKNSMIMLHSVQGRATGSPEELRAEAEVLDKFNSTIAQALAERTGLTVEEVTAKYLGKEVWFTAQEALDAKLIDGIEEYNAENLPDVTAGMTYEQQEVRFAAVHQNVERKSLLETMKQAIREVLGKPKEVNAALVNTLDYAARDYYDSLIYSEQSSINACKYVISNSPNAAVVAEAKTKLTECLAELNMLINKVYGEGSDAAAVVAQIEEARTGKSAEALEAKAIAQIEAKVAEGISAKLQEKDAKITELTQQVARLEKKPSEEPAPISGKKPDSEVADPYEGMDEEVKRYAEVRKFDFKKAMLKD